MKISLIIPVRDEAKSIERLLASISAQTRSPDEVIFVDAGSSDRTKYLIEKHSREKTEIVVISAGAVYPGTARNIGVEKSRHDIIAFTDGGIELDKDWLKELTAVIEKDSSLDVIYGHYIPRVDTLFKECLALAMIEPLTKVGGSWIRLRSIASSLMKRSVWSKVGGFPSLRAGEDRVFMEKIDREPFKIGYSPAAIMAWDMPGDLKAVFSRFSNYSFHNAKALRISAWHIPTLKMYIAALMFFLLGVLISSIFFAALFAVFAFRVGKKIFSNRRDSYFNPAHIPAYFILTGFLVFFIDMAMFWGWMKYIGSKVKGRKA